MSRIGIRFKIGHRYQRMHHALVRLLLIACVGLGLLVGLAVAEQPNFVVILADDLGYGDLGCYGSQLNRTPHIDRLAAEGIRFVDFHSNGPMCTPTRVALLTGMYQQRFGSKFDGPLSGKTQRNEGLPLEAVTIAEALQEVGYATGMFGKWHLGYQPPYVPTRQGFDEFRGLMSGDGDHHSHIDRSGNRDWWYDESIEMEAGYTADLLTRHSIDFIERHQNESFFLYVPHLAIHFPWQGPTDPAHRVAGTDYWNDKWGIIPDRNNVSRHVRAMVESLDQSVGMIVAALERLHLDQRTLVIFLSDNGGYTSYGSTHRNISSNFPLRGQKAQMFEGGHRVPAIAWWPGRIQPRVCRQTIMTFDWFPTFLHLANSDDGRNEAPDRALGSPKGRRAMKFDGVDLVSVMFHAQSVPQRTLFWRMDNEHAVRRGPWKLVSIENHPRMIFNLDDDIGEQQNLATQRPRLVAELGSEYEAWEQDVSSERIK